eukprot:PLAT11303.1.p1 GENE.PLAT11303.1~~PLAT11303.1.p1  ORF type:complete len:444 (+),score=176.33 PLAT11303.1:67-1332(+)
MAELHDSLISAAEEREAETRRVFMKYDTSKNGFIEIEELKQIMVDLTLDDTEGDGFTAFLEAEFARADKNADGEISYMEFVEYYNRLQDYVREKATAAGKEVPHLEAFADSEKREFRQVYRLGATLGSGNYSIVKECFNIETGARYACKMMRKSKLSSEDVEALGEEIAVMKSLDHPNIVSMVDFFETRKMYYIVMELISGGELFDYLVEQERFTEKRARHIFLQFCDTVSYCHRLGIVHRDLKPENLLLTSKDDDCIVKVADFGFARFKHPGEATLTTICGTPGYIAPEILEGAPYTEAVDVWSLGVILYCMLCGYPPFYSESQPELFALIRSGTFEFHSPEWDAVSEEAKGLIRGMLTVDVSRRLSAAEVLKHPWCTADLDEALKLVHTVDNLKIYMRKRRFKAGARTVVALKKFHTIL